MMINKNHIVSRLLATVLTLCLLNSCMYLLEKKNNKYKDIDKDDIAAEFADGSRTLPVMFLDTEGHHGINNKDYWKDAEIEIFTPEGRTDDTDVEIKGRGNSTWSFPKKPFNISLEDSHQKSLLGLPEAEKFCMLANWRDRTRIRNAVALEIARRTSMEWTPQGRFVDLVLDDDWHGNYYLTEKVEPEKLNLGKQGFMLFIDDHYDKTYRFRSKFKDLPVNILIADDVSLDAATFKQIRDFFDQIEASLYYGVGNWNEYIDIQSFCDWFLIHELTGTDEPSDPKGIYTYCRGDGVLHAGPCWDFDYHTFRPGSTGLTNPNAFWFDALLKKPEFKAMLKQRWGVIKPLLEDYIPSYIDSLYKELLESITIDHQLWPYKNIKTNGDESLTFYDAVQRLKQGFTEKMAVLDNYCNNL